MRQVRADAVRSRQRILDAAREHPRGSLSLNAVARDAGLGVGTVYRHFPTAHALVEALSVETLERMVEIARTASAQDDTRSALATFLENALALQLEDGGLQAVLLSPDDEEDDVRALKVEIFESFEAVLDRARHERLVRDDLTIAQLEHLICGVEHAVRLGDHGDRRLFLDVLLGGIRPE